MLFGARAFVFIVYVILGASFIAETALLAWEFWDSGWLMLATHDSHLFLFFPTLGLVALAAFYLPSCAFVDMYWRYVRLGRLRFIVGIIAVSAISYLIGSGLAASPYKSVWDLSPATLAADKSEPAGCGTATRPCERVALLEAISSVAQVSGARLGLKEFIRNCEAEPLFEAESAAERKRFCFASTPLSAAPKLSTDAECCRAQERFKSAIGKLYETPSQRSLTGQVHELLLPLKVFFLLVLLAISVLLALRHDGVARHYPTLVGRIEVGVLVGAIAMIFFPLMSQGFVQTADALYGVQQGQGFKPIVTFMSFIFGAWALLIVLFFFRRHTPEVELAAKLAGVVASTVAVVKYDLLVALIVRYLGSGAGEIAVAALIALALISVIVLLSPLARRTIVAPEKDSVT
jgi:hypothetical protein